LIAKVATLEHNGSVEASADRLTLDLIASVRPTGAGNWSREGDRIAFYRADTDGVDRLYVIDAAGGAEWQAMESAVLVEMSEGTDRRDVMGGPQWSPVSDIIACLRRRQPGPGIGICLVDPRTAGARPREILAHRADDRSLRWSPDGKRIAFVGNRDGRDNIFVGAIDDEPWQLTYDRWDNTDPAWSPDGSTLAFISQRSDVDLFSNSICTIPAAGGEIRRLTHDERANERSPRWSPDGLTIAFVSNREDIDDIWLVDVESAKLTKLTGGPGDKGDPRWSPDGRVIAYTHVLDANVRLESMEVASRNVAVLRDEGVNTLPRWSPEGTRILYSHADASHPDDLWITEVSGSQARSHRQLTHAAGTSLEGIEFATSELVSFKSRDGMEIQGLQYQPPRRAAEPGPAILWVRGGPNAVHVNGWHPLLQYFAQRGYTILAPNYRGSTGSGRTFMEANFGVTTDGDMDDWLGAADHLRALPTVDPNRVAIMGRSYGGYATLLALGVHPGEFQAGVGFCSPSDWFAYYENCEIGWGRRLHIKLMGLPIRNRETQGLRSPITYAAAYKAPVLILQGDADIGVPYRQAMAMADELRAHGKRYECVIYPGENHVYTGQYAIKDSTARIEAFLATHLSTQQGVQEGMDVKHQQGRHKQGRRQ